MRGAEYCRRECIPRLWCVAPRGILRSDGGGLRRRIFSHGERRLAQMRATEVTRRPTSCGSRETARRLDAEPGARSPFQVGRPDGVCGTMAHGGEQSAAAAREAER